MVEQSEDTRPYTGNPEDYNPLPKFSTDYICNKPLDQIVVAIDPAFQVARQDKIVEAWSEWQAVLQDKYPVKVIFPDELSLSLEPCVVKILKHDHPESQWLGWTAGFYGDNAKPWAIRIWIKSTLSGEDLRKTTLHELGHLLWLAHSTDVSSIMFPRAPLRSGEHPSDQDKYILCQIWKC